MDKQKEMCEKNEKLILKINEKIKVENEIEQTYIAKKLNIAKSVLELAEDGQLEHRKMTNLLAPFLQVSPRQARFYLRVVEFLNPTTLELVKQKKISLKVAYRISKIEGEERQKKLGEDFSKVEKNRQTVALEIWKDANYSDLDLMNALKKEAEDKKKYKEFVTENLERIFNENEDIDFNELKKFLEKIEK